MDFFRRLRPPRSPKTLSSLDAYAKWAATYPPHAHNLLMETEEAAMRRLMLPLDGLAALDLACGTGRYGLLAEQSGAGNVIGLDNSPAMLLANPLPQKALATTEAVPLPSESMDVILCGLALGHLPRLQPSFSEMARLLRAGGWALVSDFHPFIYLNGARRTFTGQDGSTYAVEHYLHLYSDYYRAATEAGLHIDALAEPQLNGAPVVIVYRLRK
jgi:malonyl-CoA O-methyltransferase